MFGSAHDSIWHIVCVTVINIIDNHIVFIVLPIIPWENYLNS